MMRVLNAPDFEGDFVLPRHDRGNRPAIVVKGKMGQLEPNGIVYARFLVNVESHSKNE